MVALSIFKATIYKRLVSTKPFDAEHKCKGKQWDCNAAPLSFTFSVML